MKNHILHFTSRVLPVVAGVPMCLLLQFSSASEASPPLSNEAHFHGVVDAEALRARDSIYAAGKQAMNVNAGEPRTVRMFYFLPNDRPFRQEVVDSIKTMMRRLQAFYAEQMETHGHGRMSFRYETDAQGDPLVHRVDGQHPDSHYRNQPLYPVLNEIKEPFPRGNNVIYFIVIDNSTGSIQFGRFGAVAGIGGEESASRRNFPYGWPVGGYVFVPSGFSFSTVAHEFGHAFGLDHDFRDKKYIMSYGGSESNRLSACAARILSVHPCFNSDIPIRTGESGSTLSTIELVSPVRYPAGASSVSVQLQVGDPAGLRQVTLYANTKAIESSSGFPEVLACRELAGEKETVVEFEYDGVVPSAFLFGIPESLSDPPVHQFQVEVTDTDGYKISSIYGIAQSSPYLVTTLEGQGAVAFSPDGNTLAVGLFTRWSPDTDTNRKKVRLWDMATRKEIATLDVGTLNVPSSLAFSPDGNTLAIASRPCCAVRLWDVATQKEIATIEAGNSVASLSFSPDGNTLAYLFHDKSIRLWDVATREEIAILEGHSEGVWSVAFSPDGNTLASGSDDGTIRLWDVTTQKEIANIVEDPGRKRYDGVVSLAFSPDGNTLASGSRHGTVKLWDVATRKEIANLEGHPTPYSYPYMVFSLAFSPDASTLASGSQDGTVRLWDVATRKKIATLVHLDHVISLAFSPEGTRLAAATYGNIELWDMSAFVTPVAVIPDANLRGAIRDALGLAPFAPITVTEIARLTTLDASNRDIRELNGLESAINLTEVNLEGNPLSSSAMRTHVSALRERGVAVAFDALMTSDFSGDGVVDFTDFLQFAARFGLSQGDAGYDPRFDLDGDGEIGFGDFLIFARSFGS